ncbi:MAG: cyclase family protein [Bacilli bacterium]|nr:cyclase family protein [Bacilli bacterium]
MRLIDLSYPLNNESPVYPGDPSLTIKKIKDYDKDGYSLNIISTSMHVGTHVDAPSHLTEISKTIDEYPLDCFYGRGVIINAYGEKSIDYKKVYEDMIHPQDCVLIYTGHDEHYPTDKYFYEHPFITKDMAHFLVNKKVKLVGIDFPSPDYPPFEIHKILLSNDIILLENVCNLEKLLGRFNFKLICFPLNIKIEASLVRAVALIDD